MGSSAAQASLVPGAAPAIAIRGLCKAAALGPGKEAVALTALGSISNMYCLWALSHPGDDQVEIVDGFLCSRVATREATVREIMKAVPGLGADEAGEQLVRLERALETAFLAKGGLLARLPGLGVLERVEGKTVLVVELPLAGVGIRGVAAVN